MPTVRTVSRLFAGVVVSAAAAIAHAQPLPTGFVNSLAANGFTAPVGVAFATDGRAFIWEKGGTVRLLDGGVVQPFPVIDISQEVGDWRDFGLLGFALDPNFTVNGLVYLSYVVDYHHARWFGTAQYNPNSNEYYRDTIGRVTRYQLNAADNFRSVVSGSRLVLIGESLSTGIPLCHQSHGIGSLAFGDDGTLIVGTGDAGSYEEIDNGGPRNGSSNTALADGIITAAENVGAFRAQLLDSHCGKMLRIDPATGNGVPSNPFYNAAAPRSPRSRVWALGFRNPFRFSMRPGSGNPSPAAADPGSIYIGDVGWGNFEELDVVTTGGLGSNFGWPVYEGYGANFDGYPGRLTDNLAAANPLAGGACPLFFDFQDLLIPATLAAPSWPNPCNTAQQIPAPVGRFMHHRPALDWGRGGPFRCGSFSGNNPTIVNVGAGAPVTGGGFNPGGSCAVGGDWYEGTAFPAAYRDSYYMGEFTNGWIHQVRFNAADQPTQVISFASGLAGLVDVEYNPNDQAIYYINLYTSELRRISFGLNNPPVVVVTPAVAFGPLPLTVNYSSAGTSDPDNDALSYAWDFGDGTTSTSPNPSHTFNDYAPLGAPKRFDVTLRVTDARGIRTTRTLLVSGNNTPPVIQITSPMNGALFGATQFTQPLRATVIDVEHGATNQYACSWLATLYHNTHQHREPLNPNCAPDVLVDGVSHQGEVFCWGFRLTVIDGAGLSDTEEVFMFRQPLDCNNNGIPDGQDIADGTSDDCNESGVPDECEYAAGGTGSDCDHNAVLDECQAASLISHHFDSGPAPFVLNGSAFWPGNGSEEIILTPIAGGQLGSMVRPPLRAQPLTYFQTRFQFRTGGGSGADGFSYCALNSANYNTSTNFGEEGLNTNALVISFDTYDNGSEGENVIEAKYNGGSLATYVPSFDLEDNNTHTAIVRVTPRGLTVQVSTTPTTFETAFADVPLPGWGPVSWLMAFGGRTGGATNEHAIAHVRFTTPTSLDLNFDGILDSCQCRANFNGSTGPSGGVSVQDIFDFLAAYFAGNLRADFNGTATLSVQDVFDFLAAYFAGC